MAALNIRKVPYKDFLQPTLHRRFITTGGIVLVVAYAQAVLLATWDSFFWSWFPLGPAGPRTAILFFCGALIILLRIAQWHVGYRTSTSGIETFLQYAPRFQTVETVLTYVISALVFSQVYLASLGHGSRLDWLEYYSENRARLNERPLFFTANFVILGVGAALVHLWLDDDRLLLGYVRPEGANGGDAAGGKGSKIRRLWEQVPAITITSINAAAGSVLVTLITYQFFLRAPLWRFTMMLLRPFYVLPKTNMIPITWPFNVWILTRSFSAGFLLMFMWTLGNSAFSLFLVRAPLKNGKPLTSESKDPNGSLLNGLKSKKSSIQCHAMWELALIARDFEPRRKAIYEDIDRKDGPMWSQVYAICLEIIKGVELRIDNYGKNPTPPVTAPAQKAPERKRTTAPLKEDPIFVTTPKRKDFRDEVEKVVRKVTTSPDHGSPFLSPAAKRAADFAKENLLLAHRKATGSDDPQGNFQNLIENILAYPVSYPLRKEYRQQLTATVLGTPYGEPSLYVNAISALGQLVSHSLAEDRYGNVQRDVPAILRALTTVTKKLEAFKVTLPIHWTDVYGKRESPEADEILEALKVGLSQLIQDFGPYARDLRLSATDMRLAREAAGAAEPDQVAR